MLWTALKQADWHTLAEWFGIENEEAVADAALQHLQLEPAMPESFDWLEIYYRPEGLRPVSVKRFVQGDAEGHVKDMREELERGAADRSDAGLVRVFTHLAQVQEVVSIEFSAQPWNDPGWPMGEVIAYEVARWVAKNGDGYVEDHGRSWWALDGWTWKQIDVRSRS